MISPTSKPSERVHRHGFTLLELLLAISLMGLMLGLSLPRIGAVKTSYFAIEETENLINAIRTARIEAVNARTAVALTTDTDNPGRLDKRRLAIGSWQAAETTVQTARPGSWQAIWDAPIIGSTIVSGRLQLQAPAAGILFFADGSSTGGEIVICAEDGSPRHHILVVAATGETFVQR